MFERPHHQRIAQALQALDAALLRDNHCLFAGGTVIALRYGEYRESVDIDFLVSDVAGYRSLRQLLTGADGIIAVVRQGAELRQVREVRADQYGIRTMLEVEGFEIKFEIVLEARVKLAEPTHEDVVCDVATLTPLDMATSKLLANSDRWRDDGVFSRDLIDLAMMAPKRALFTQALTKAGQAYGDNVMQDLAKAINALATREGRLERCMAAMEMQIPKAVLWQKIRALQKMLP